MTTVPTVTVAIPTRNRASLLAIALESALDQTFADTEILVLDDASTDETPDLVRRYDDPRIRYVRHDPNIGMAENWSYGYVAGSGTYVAVLHDDDYWAPTFLERAVAMFEAEPRAGLVYAAIEPVDALGRPAGHRPLSLGAVDRMSPPDEAVQRLVKSTEVGWPAIMVRRECMLELGGFTEEFPYHKDWAIWIELAARYPVGYLSETLGYYRIHADQFSVDYGDESGAIARDRFEMLWATIPGLPLPATRRAELLKIALRSLAETQLVTAWDAARAGESARAREEARFAFTIDPTVGFRSPQMVAAAYLASWLPGWILNRLDQARAVARPVFRRT